MVRLRGIESGDAGTAEGVSPFVPRARAERERSLPMPTSIEQGMTIVEYPTTLSTRVAGSFKMRTLRVMGDHARYLAHLWREKRSQDPDAGNPG